MQRRRVAVLVGLAVVAVLAFLLAPTDGRFARVPLMVLCGVLALIWHLAAEGAGAVASDADTPATAPSPEAAQDDPVHPAGFFEMEAGSPAGADAGAAPLVHEVDEPELAHLPDPPANWPPTVVEVPLVFQLDDPLPASESVSGRAEDHVPQQVIDLTESDTAGPGSVGLDLSDLDLSDLGLSDGVEAPLEPEVAPDAPAPADEDPWLAFAATMFAPGAR